MLAEWAVRLLPLYLLLVAAVRDFNILSSITHKHTHKHMQAFRTWRIASDIIQAKRFAVAIYNIGLIGSVGYFVGSSLR